ncbi:MAG: purine-nucleoside phosphorylase [Aliidiomarina sp.]|uniref:purine-nucleoside phosphorylase n=1 Tax=Aliidiomarina sp. TaxID=1872439 RepID=UPI0025C47C93|nr:purine-nucleoside phosphorylase [Aliidiomarina sp.]MCH8500843.1 purine-nucleoside phosphorylase [Aliidiomarina sp.]
MTPHIHAEPGDFAETVLMPGDPLRAKFIAETFLQDVREVNHVRNMLAYTGTYQGKPVSVMGSGMGMASIGIYSWELFTHFGVQSIIRVGSCGAYTSDLKLYDVVLAQAAWSESSYARTQNGYVSPVTHPSASLNEALTLAAKQLDIPLTVGTVHSSDVFYRAEVDAHERLFREQATIAVEMESFALFHNAQVLGKRAACILTVSDHLVTHEAASAEDREQAFTHMMKIALHTA